MRKFRYGIHIMWYELEMIEEHFHSLRTAMQLATWPIDIIVHFNMQTYIETPTDPDVMSRFLRYRDEFVATLPNVTILQSTMDEPFYNAPDFRREYSFGIDSGYCVQGEIDSVLPETYFAALEAAYDIISDGPHVISFASRKMWDHTWIPVEHYAFQGIPRDQIDPPFDNEHYITEDQVNEFNLQFQPTVEKLYDLKIDGCLLAIRDGVPAAVPPDVSFGPDDFICEAILKVLEIPQYHFPTILKGHNYRHPRKRVGTSSTRNDEIYKRYYKEAFDRGKQYVIRLQKSLLEGQEDEHIKKILCELQHG